MKKISILGATGSIGQNTLDLISNKKELDKFINNSKYKSYNKLLMSSGNFDGYNVGE